MFPHSVGNLLESSNVGTNDQGGQSVLRVAKLGTDLEANLEAALHDALELLIDLFGSPLQASRVLGHFETRDSDTTAVGSLSGGVPDRVMSASSARLEHVDGLLCATHVGSLCDELDASSNEGLGLLLGDFVLSGTRKGNISLGNKSPGALA